MTEQEILEIYQRAGAVWFFDYKGDPKAPHAELSSGLCSDSYVNSPLVMSHPQTVQTLAFWMTRQLEKRNVRKVDWVIGSAYSAITFSFEVARHLGARHGLAKKDPTDSKKMVWDELVIPGHAEVLQCEDVVTTLGTALEVRRAVEEGNPEPVRWLPDVATAIHWPVKFQGGLIDVVSLVAREAKTWEFKECPHCASGSPRLRPKGENWARLMRKAA